MAFVRGIGDAIERGEHGYITYGISLADRQTAAIEGSAISPRGIEWGATFSSAGFKWNARGSRHRHRHHYRYRHHHRHNRSTLPLRGRRLPQSITDCWRMMNVSYKPADNEARAKNDKAIFLL